MVACACSAREAEQILKKEMYWNYNGKTGNKKYFNFSFVALASNN